MGVRALNERVSKGGDWEDKAHAWRAINVVVHYMQKLEQIKSSYLAQQAKQKKGTVKKL